MRPEHREVEIYSSMRRISLVVLHPVKVMYRVEVVVATVKIAVQMDLAQVVPVCIVTRLRLNSI